MSKKFLGFFLVVLVGTASCAGMTKRRNDEVLKKVKTVAIVGFDSLQPAPPGSLPKTKGRVEEMYSAFVSSFARQTRWSVVSGEAVRNNAAYQSAYQKTMTGFQNKSLPRQRERKFFVTGVMDNDSLRLLGTEGRTRLMKALGVDALVTAQVEVIVNGMLGSLHPQSRVSLEVYVANADSSDWFESGIWGDESPKSVGATGFYDADKLAEMALISAKSAYGKISVK